jgi:hypothetical protein
MVVWLGEVFNMSPIALTQVMSGLEVLLKDSPLQPWVAVNSRLLFKTLPLCDDDEAYTDADVFSSSSLSMNWAQAAT